jgi:peroxiredoxin
MENALQPGQQLPVFRLPTVHGSKIDLTDFRQRRNVIVLLLGKDPNSAARQLLAALAQNHALFGEENTVILAVLAGTAAAALHLHQQLALPFALLVDAEQAVHQRVPGSRNPPVTPLVYILDRAGVVVASYADANAVAPPTADELLAWVRYLELRCPE